LDATKITRLAAPLVPWITPGLRVMSEWNSTRDRRGWPAPPRDDGRPAMLIPGFLAGDQSLTRMAVWLRSGGYVLTRTGISWNTGCTDETVDALVIRLERAVEKAGRPAVVIGQSRGGTIGRVLAVHRPDLVDTLVTLGSPLLDPLAVHPHVLPSIMAVSAMGSAGVPGMFSNDCLRGECCQRSRQDLDSPFPDHVNFVSLYSRTDEVVRWRSCLDPAAIHVEIHASHVGMGMARESWMAVAHHLRGRSTVRQVGAASVISASVLAARRAAASGAVVDAGAAAGAAANAAASAAASAAAAASAGAAA
jgi:pimeloyl-ACP methyl ester carboxylesterase